MKLLIKKIFRDLFKDKRRTIMAFLAIFFGTLSFAIFTFSNEIIVREIKSVFDKSNPASAVVMVSGIDDKAIELTDEFSDFDEYELKASYDFKGRTKDGTLKHLQLIGLEDYSNLKLNKFSYEKGQKVPEKGEALIDRGAIKVADKKIGDDIEVLLPDGTIYEFKIVGTVEESYLHPAIIHDSVYIYISEDSLRDMGLSFNRIDYQIDGDKHNKNDIINVNTEYSKLLEANGYKISSVDISETPGVSMHYSEYKAGIFLINLFSFISFIFGCLIITSLLSSIMLSEVKQIGILKAIGVSTKKISRAYIMTFFTLIFSFVGLSFILAHFIKNIMSSFLLNIANLHVDDYSVSIQTYFIFFILALVIPLIIIYFNIRKSISITVKDAIQSYGVSGNNISVVNSKIKFLSRPTLLSIRNSFRKRRRFVLNILTLSLAGSMFIAILNTMITLNNDLEENMDRMNFDYQIYTDAKDKDEFSKNMMSVDKVKDYEIFKNSNVRLMYKDGSLGNTYKVVSVPSNSEMFIPDIIEGRWFNNNENNEIVIGHKLFQEKNEYGVGNTIKLESNGILKDFLIVGIVKSISENSIYMNEELFDEFIPRENSIYNVKINAGLTNSRKDQALVENLEKDISDADINIFYSQTQAKLSKMSISHYSITIWIFFLVILTLIIISAFGLTATTLLQTSERKKEIGIIKAMGASKKQVKRIITAESLFMAIVAFMLSVIISIPLSFLSIYIFEKYLIEMPLENNKVYFILSCIIWFILVVIIAYRSSLSSVKRSFKLKIKDILVQD